MRPHKMCGITEAHHAHEFVNGSGVGVAAFQQIYACPGVPHRPVEVEPGPCWHNSGITWPGEKYPVHCELRAGHAGAHECDRGSMGGTAVWTDTYEAEETS